MDTIKELTLVAGTSEADNETIEATIAAVRDLVEDSEFARDGRNSLGTSCSDQNIECEDDIYRSIDGLCNNLAQADWGAAGRRLLRSETNIFWTKWNIEQLRAHLDEDPARMRYIFF